MPYRAGKAMAPKPSMLIFILIYNDLRGIGLPAGLIFRQGDGAKTQHVNF
jgi:hypothetical protein